MPPVEAYPRFSTERKLPRARPRMKTGKRILTPISLISAAGLALTGCSSGPDGVYDFTRSEYEVSYGDDAFETLTAPRYTEEDAEEDVDSEIIDLANRDLYIPVGSADELEEHLLEQVEEYPDFEEELIDRLWYAYSEHMQDPRDAPATIEEAVQEVRAGYREFYDEKVAEADRENVSPRLSLGSSYSMDDFDEDSLIPFRFPARTEDGNRTFATVDLTVMRNGDVSVAGSEVNGYVVDANGDWITGDDE
ncbi:hypothetical protein [Nocardiopsis sp. LDBS1602]|uniref:hypothetical protein n=1 Tax=Nocardiopsis sp. LDBS1602 TaxID=3109597 RepID=UPI002DBDC25E|nr:hypothetical protein [Nocardiopsis sp. LDBS1602]MEC3895171.1 hypothetical protein [Nocardiopsis sp. LDBS1602]